jgi:hypothetical protein
MRKNRYPYSTNEPSSFRVVAYTLAIAIIAIKTFAAICRMLVRTVDGIADSRSTRA